MKLPFCLYRLCLPALIACHALLPFPQPCAGQSVSLSLSLDGGGVRHVQFTGDPTNYYILYRGTAVTNVATAVHVALDSQPITTLQDTNTQGAASFYRVLSIGTNTPLDLDGDGMNDVAELLANRDPLVPQLSGSGLVINEVDYDQINADINEFVEIYNPTADPVSLAGRRLGFINGANNTQYLSVDLSPAGMLAAGQYLVVKSATVVADPGALTINFVAAQDNVQNGSPDALGILDSITGDLIEALSYEGSVTAGVITGFGSFNFVEGTVLSGTVADSNAVVGSLCRIPNGTDTNDADSDWKFSTTPTPGSANVP